MKNLINIKNDIDAIVEIYDKIDSTKLTYDENSMKCIISLLCASIEQIYECLDEIDIRIGKIEQQMKG